MSETMPPFPAFLKLAGRRVLVVGAGPVAASKLAALVHAGASIAIVAPEISGAMRETLAQPQTRAGMVSVTQRAFQLDDLDDVWFVVAAAPPEINRAVAAAAEGRRLFVNAVDDPPNASMYLGGVVRRDGVTVAISTNGRAPALAGLLREGLDDLLPDDLTAWLQTADQERARWKATGVPMEARRPQLLRAINNLYEEPRIAESSTAESSTAESKESKEAAAVGELPSPQSPAPSPRHQ